MKQSIYAESLQNLGFARLPQNVVDALNAAHGYERPPDAPPSFARALTGEPFTFATDETGAVWMIKALVDVSHLGFVDYTAGVLRDDLSRSGTYLQ